jgi:hypothetical protein
MRAEIEKAEAARIAKVAKRLTAPPARRRSVRRRLEEHARREVIVIE